MPLESKNRIPEGDKGVSARATEVNDVRCPACGRRLGRSWRRRFDATQKAAIAHQYYRLGMRQTVLAKLHDCSQGTISRIVTNHGVC